jgi:hypothetical protein
MERPREVLERLLRHRHPDVELRGDRPEHQHRRCELALAVQRHLQVDLLAQLGDVRLALLAHQDQEGEERRQGGRHRREQHEGVGIPGRVPGDGPHVEQHPPT